MRKTETITKITCDICSKIIKEDEAITVKYPVVFTTEMTEGRSVNPYIAYEKLDCCIDCSKKILKITGYGAQGYNNYGLIESSTLIEHAFNNEVDKNRRTNNA